MSAHLKKFVPPGSLNSDLSVQEVAPAAREDRFKEDKLVGQAWKISSLHTSIKTLADSSERLNKEVRKEKLFWNSISDNFSNRDMLYKTRDRATAKRIFAIKFGYEDSGSTYRKKGAAILKPSADGNNHIEVVPMDGAEPTEKRVLRVRIRNRTGDLVGESKLQNDTSSDGSLRSRIERERFFIFEEELFVQLVKEAIDLMGSGVELESDYKILIHLNESDDSAETIELEYVDPSDTGSSDIKLESHDRSSFRRAELISLYLRLMLTIKFKRNLESKQQIKVLSSKSREESPKPENEILKPLVGHFNHECLVKKLYQMIKTALVKSDRTKLEILKYSNTTTQENKQDPFKRVLTSPATVFQIIRDNVVIKVELISINFTGFKICVAIEAGDGNSKTLKINFEELEEFHRCLLWIAEEYGF